MISVVTFLWHDSNYRWNRYFTYDPAHVDKLARGVRKHLKMPYQFLCVTDYDPLAFEEPDAVIPLWGDHRDLGGCYVRLKAFSSEMREILGERFVWFDVDVVIVGSLDSLLERPEEIVLWKDITPPTPYCGSMVMMTAGARKQVWEDFDPITSPVSAQKPGYIGTDQAWIGYKLGLNEATWSTEDGVLSYQRHIKDEYGGQLPDHAKVVVFHGPYDPSQVEAQEQCPWIKEHWI